jgi:hypothetical protein
MWKKPATMAAVLGATVAVGIFGAATLGGASSHREAPYIATDPQADATDVYAFVSPDNPDTVTFIANYVPLQVPPAGPNFYSFGDDVLYEINVDNDGDALEDITFQFRFESELNPDNAFGGATFLNNTGPITSLDDPDLNQRQFYSVSVMNGEGSGMRPADDVLAEGLQVAPANVGPASYPEGYAQVAEQAVFDIEGGIKVFAGPRDDPFFVSLGPIFDLLNAPLFGDDYVAGLNVHSIVIQVPIDMLSADGQMPTGPDDPDAIIGVRTTSYRQSLQVLRNIGSPTFQLNDPDFDRGPWVQLSRLDLPLINEVVIPLQDKNRWNSSKPKNDGQFLGYVTGEAPGSTPGGAPHLGALLNLVLGVQVPAAPRTDLVDALLLGIDGLNRPANVVASSQLRLNMAIPPSETPNPLGAAAGDLAGFPNGRRLADDVTDIELSVVAGFFVPEDGEGPNDDLIGDGAGANDVPFLDEFPYVNVPHDYAGASYGMP